MVYNTSSFDEYCQMIPAERREIFTELRQTIRTNLPDGFVEDMLYNMPSFVVPLSIYPAGYHCRPGEPLPFISIASQKHFIGFYHMGIYAMPDILAWFQSEWNNHCSVKLDMGKSCIRLKKMESIPLALLGDLCTKISVQQWIDFYESSVSSRKGKSSS